ncbi:MAG TPA: enoyl-CoA hydratase-related protein [Candidatus Acidoferrales bacterium]|nr:enoyl-CoA hydratase-related protein [Candidatus Acidoferrales bacterium]
MAVLLYEKKDRIAYLTLNRPEALNAINSELRDALLQAWKDFNGDDGVWVAIVTGAGDRAFCVGGDLKERAARDRGEGGRQQGRLLPSLTFGLGIWKPVIAAINGYCLGGGFQLAQSCDIRIAADHALLGVTEVKRGMAAPWTVDLAKMIGLAHALEIALTGEHITAQRAYEMGFVNKVVPGKELMNEAERWARILVENAPLAVRGLKELLYRCVALPQEQAEAIARHIVHPVLASEDIKEGPRAFAEKRKPVWRGR